MVSQVARSGAVCRDHAGGRFFALGLERGQDIDAPVPAQEVATLYRQALAIRESVERLPLLRNTLVAAYRNAGLTPPEDL